MNTTELPLSRTDPAANRVGRLRFVGGLELKADDMRFGGISAMVWEPGCNRLLAISDSGSWLALEPKEDGERLLGIRQAWIAPVLGPNGQPPVSKEMADSEALAPTADGALWVHYEGDHRAERFMGVSACHPESLATVPERTWRPADSALWPGNGGMEAAAGQGNRRLVILEAVPGPTDGTAGFSVEADGQQLPFEWPAPKGYNPTEISQLEGDRMLVLHRRFTPLEGVRAILMEGAFPAHLPARIDAQEIARLEPPINIDNMEAMAIRTEQGRHYVYLASDNNFNRVQRTLLLKFELLEGAGKAP